LEIGRQRQQSACAFAREGFADAVEKAGADDAAGLPDARDLGEVRLVAALVTRPRQ